MKVRLRTRADESYGKFVEETRLLDNTSIPFDDS